MVHASVNLVMSCTVHTLVRELMSSRILCILYARLKPTAHQFYYIATPTYNNMQSISPFVSSQILCNCIVIRGVMFAVLTFITITLRFVDKLNKCLMQWYVAQSF